MEERANSLVATLDRLPPHKITPSARSRLSKFIRSEIRFIHGLSPLNASGLNSTNLGYLEAVVQAVQHPWVDAVSVVFQTFKSPDIGGDSSKAAEVHVDVVCTFHGIPVWIVVSDRNPRYLNWFSERNGTTNWSSRVKQLVFVARSLNVLRPRALLFCYTRGVPDSLSTGFIEEVGASPINAFNGQAISPNADREVVGINLKEIVFETDDEDWIYIDKQTDLCDPILDVWVTFKVDIEGPVDRLEVIDGDHKVLATVTSSDNQYEQIDVMEDDEWNKDFLSIVTALSQQSSLYDGTGNPLNLLNLDTTALVASVSEISNGAASMLVNMCREDLVSKFKNTAQFMRDQAVEELKMPLMKELKDFLENKRPFISESVYKEFKSLISLCGGTKERRRAHLLLKVLPMVPDSPSARIMDLSETGSIKLKNKVIFGTGDYWQAPTLTANLSFVRAVRQTGMALSILEHKPRALMGEKCS